jgi:hypothetical protein
MHRSATCMDEQGKANDQPTRGDHAVGEGGEGGLTHVKVTTRGVRRLLGPDALSWEGCRERMRKAGGTREGYLVKRKSGIGKQIAHR